jgi:hypothetical protein
MMAPVEEDRHDSKLSNLGRSTIKVDEDIQKIRTEQNATEQSLARPR